MTRVLSFDNLTVRFDTPEGVVRAVNGLSFSISSGECVGIVGESGSGKSQAFLAALGLLAKNGSAEGAVLFRGENLLSLDERALNRYRGADIAMIFQEPMSCLTPNVRIGTQLCEPLIVHRGVSRKTARARAREALEQVHVPEPDKRLRQYPHELSGGMQQRVLIAMALLCEPSVIIADEPTTALDVTIQAEILSLFQTLKAQSKTAIVLITHDLAVIAGVCDRIMVMYAGRIVEAGTVDEIFADPQHPYTRGLLACTPRLDRPSRARLATIPGQPPDMQHLPGGCVFLDRCEYAHEKCLEPPSLRSVSESGHTKACHLNGF